MFPLHLIDAFTDRPFTGNPAAVCLLDRSRPDDWMQKVAMEMNQAETAFLLPEGDAFRLRWFTPLVEVDLCGHATLASAHFLWETGRASPSESIAFETRSGRLTASRVAEGIELDFPALPARRIDPMPPLACAIGCEPSEWWHTGMDYLLLLANAAAVRALAPDFLALAQIETRGIMATAPSDDATSDFVSRFFAPAAGIPEDPVTGSAHCALGPFWSARCGKTEFVGRQLSRRGGVVRVRLTGDRAILSGRAVTTVRGELTAK